jgi:hypothetical protein
MQSATLYVSAAAWSRQFLNSADFDHLDPQ